MPNREELHISAETHVLDAVAAATAAQTSASIDTAGFDSAHFNVAFGAIAPALTGLKITESDDNTTFTDAPASAMVNDYDTSALLPNKTVRIAYIGNKRYAECVVTPSAATDILGITAHRGLASQKPVNNPI
jgi:hypothetical protein